MPTGVYDHTCRQIDMTGQTIGYAHIDSLNRRTEYKSSFWNCTCLYKGCGKRFVRSRAKLLEHKDDANCGCFSREKRRAIDREKSLKYRPYGKELDSILWGMKKRCYSPSNASYKNYGARGITVCDEWTTDRETFYEWAIRNGYQKGLTIDRVDPDKGYSPDNCRWISPKAQQNNKRNNRHVEYKGKIYTVAELAELIGIPYETLRHRLNSKTYNLPIDAPLGARE
jgi:hypothetical protein